MNNKIIGICLVVSSLLFVNIASAQLNTEAPDELTALLNQLLGEEESEAAVSPTNEPLSLSEDERILYILDEPSLVNGLQSSISVDIIDSNTVKINTSKVLSGDQEVQHYRIYFSSEGPVSEIEPRYLDDVVVLKKDLPDDQSLVMLSLENLSPDTMYYINVVPLDPENLNVEIGNLKSDEISFTTPSIQPAIAASTPVNNFLTTKPTSNPATKSTPAMTTKTFVDYTRRPVDKNVTIQSINKRSDDEFGWVSRTTHYKSFPAYLDKKDLGKAKKSIFEPVSYAQRMALVGKTTTNTGDKAVDERYFSELMITVRDLKKETRMLLNKTRLTSNADALAFSMDAFFQADDMVEKLNEENNSVTINELETAIENIRLDMKKVTDLIG